MLDTCPYTKLAVAAACNCQGSSSSTHAWVSLGRPLRPLCRSLIDQQKLVHPCAGMQELRLKVLALRAFNLETMLIGEHVKSKEPIVTQIRWVMTEARWRQHCCCSAAVLQQGYD